MLIVPLHRAPTWKNFPWMTCALIVVNVFVFAVLQSGDARARVVAIDRYLAHGLPRIEFPTYADWLRDEGESERAEAFDLLARAKPRVAAEVLQSDDTFVAALADGRIVPRALTAVADESARGDWRQARADFERAWGEVFSYRWLQRFDRFDPVTLVSATFLHAGVGHLLGNMLFLAVLGLLVEGALGRGLFLAVYLLGGIGASLVSLANHWGEPGGALGASGAVAALMGAYCVLWGMRRVRFFWWFFVAFDYVKAPALVLLPFWLGWEIWNLAFNGDAGVGFDAHAGGIVSGALLALVVRWQGWEHKEFMDEDMRADEVAGDRAALDEARACLGRLEVARARALVEPLLARRPGEFELLALMYRCARYERGMPRLHPAAFAALRAEPVDSDGVRAQKALYEDYMKTAAGAARVPASLAYSLARRWLAIGAGDEAMRLVSALTWSPATSATLARDSLAIAQAARLKGFVREAAGVLERIVAEAPDSTEAGKARALLADAGS
ncbi:MAG TPA: rhomboid family intramembrane serine protease [Dokdonella sp.]|uniref:rhomboid family intramembrane serine protease n=1 Tax=Dokdonella sp. TaxID=2291710 RepID=UPI0025BB175C|nr:rhomboid family intramembrane serine protease [Dokdonella sp.]MBX3691907.1 rhomboid family intramembrane serine protease [Dokdonella sp.]MCW5568928.1 rhomboid family intramembrane serine protease [Dokdonella sp.]HNR90853.1 rhomboid family intramembrane serine protease [Dokdonella sp.]